MKFRTKKTGTRLMTRPEEGKNPSRGVFTRRALLLMAAQGAVLGTLAQRLYGLQVRDGSHYARLAENNRLSKRFFAPPRGRITDRFGIAVAANKVNWRALLLAEETNDLPGTLERFAQLVPMEPRDTARVERELRHKRRFIPIMLRDFLSWDDMARLELNMPSLPGVLIDVGTTRVYPFGPLLAHVVGYVAPPSEKDVARDAELALPGMRVGRSGIEQTQDQGLRGQVGSVEMEVNAVGRIMAELDRDEGQPGNEITLTLDSGLQQQVLGRIADQSASAVVMDCRNGEVLAMVSNPSFDPSLFDSGVSQAQWIEWTNNSQTPLINKAVSGLYPPGSTFKPAVAMAALRAGTLSPNDRINCPGYIDVGGTRFHCWSRYGHGSLTLRQGLKFSCDVFFYEVARRTGMDPIALASHQFGLGAPLDIELPHVRQGLIPTPQWRRAHGHHWNGGDTIVSGIGQGFMQVTPLQLATYAARIASGRDVQPHLVRAVGGRLGDMAALDHAGPMENMPDHFFNAIREGMYAVVNEESGTAPKARLAIPGVQMAGKTGSAQVRRVSRAMRESGHFNSANLPWEYRPHALFICFAPYDAPRYAAAVVVEHGNAGAEVAAPLARDIMTDTLMRDPVNHKESPGQEVAQADVDQG
ncbi:penicillin-binding protein 2 [Gluconacetobacter entanii]|uniref:Penicillin-binding protein 2 n=1 Tax=Gluconacetobacter entanii TaxID=108528 RepID=A0ABT3K8J6_9PROT|nr:penicillin-binding protein 2 [Gluconacetobacter entanii]MBE7620281.1 penicillin-binding protein 2 [Komagataeibacter sp. FXV2]MCE2579700.1 penicillin-binding protein 2 [Komagataeibacter sp. FNDCR1]MCW4591766.1 penicillin-binding protein 2 [Gluconacetobacter entanii]MCW4595112.1 penicillin-binding protein 2 [Gluconacetobacter entanii]NPC88001.1 penicillin-binding protein 2 [Gluconacetobacter entanii]